ncbi:MAG: hypothetical protein KAQ79_20790, partial [Cyclobacteriaceae bacterium]|nr:hypothetical protein [Cyclobacteriaceae bacterium]
MKIFFANGLYPSNKINTSKIRLTPQISMLTPIQYFMVNKCICFEMNLNQNNHDQNHNLHRNY